MANLLLYKVTHKHSGKRYNLPFGNIQSHHAGLFSLDRYVTFVFSPKLRFYLFVCSKCEPNHLPCYLGIKFRLSINTCTWLYEM